MSEPKTMMINDVEYIRKEDVTETAPKLDGMDYVIVRTYSAGVFAGYLKSKDGKEVTLVNARRLWQWTGAASLSKLATSGTSNPNGCKFPEEVEQVILTEAIEILTVTRQAQDLIASVPIWKK